MTMEEPSPLDEYLHATVTDYPHREDMIAYLLREGANPAGTAIAGREGRYGKLSMSDVACLDSSAHGENSGTAIAASEASMQRAPSDVITVTCKFCGGHGLQADMLENECVIWEDYRHVRYTACSACVPKGLPCPASLRDECETEPPHPKPCSYRATRQHEDADQLGPLITIFDMNGVWCHRARDGVRYGCPLAGNLPQMPSMVANCVPLEAPFSMTPLEDVTRLEMPSDNCVVLASMVANHVPVEAPFGVVQSMAQRDSPLSPIRLPPGDHNIAAWMYPRVFSKDLMTDLHQRSGDGSLKWGIYTTLKKRNAWPMLKLLLDLAGFTCIKDLGDNLVDYFAGGSRGSMWFFTQEDCEADSSHGAAKFANTKHVNSLFKNDILAILQNRTEDSNVMSRTVIVLGNAKKARLLHNNCLLVRDFTAESVIRNECTGLERIAQDIDSLTQALRQRRDCRPWLKAANQRFVATKYLGAAAASLGFRLPQLGQPSDAVNRVVILKSLLPSEAISMVLLYLFELNN